MLRTMIFAVLLGFAGAGAAAAPFDVLFVRHEAQSSAYELALARLAQNRAIRPEVRAYAAMLVNDHEVYGGAVRRLAASKGIAVPSELATSDKKRFDALARTRGAGFDNAFVREARRINRKEVRTLREAAAHATNPEIHRFVDRFLAVEAKHDAAGSALNEHVLASKLR